LCSDSDLCDCSESQALVRVGPKAYNGSELNAPFVLNGAAMAI